MALTQTQLSEKRRRKVMRRRSVAVGQARNALSYNIGRQRHRQRLNAEALAKMKLALEEQQEASRAAVKAATSGKRGGFMDGVKSRLFKMLPRRTGVGE